MNFSLCSSFRTLFVLLLYSSCIIFTLAMAEINNLEGSILGGHSNSTIDLVENKTLTEDIVSPPAIVAPLVDVIHGKVNSNNHVIPDIQNSIDEFPIFVKTDILPDENHSSALQLNTTTTPPLEPTLPLEQRIIEEVINLTAPEVPPPEPQQNATGGGGSQDDIPSFSEWAKKHMAEAGRPKGENLTVGSGGGKLRSKNYASPDCGAKVIMSNPEAGSPSAILSSSRDDYMLNACNVKIWFIVELCEPIQPLKIEIANFELFSSSPQELSIYTSDRYPSREWAQAGALTAKDERTIQSFQLPRISHFVKYIKVELHSHYGNEHFCPISLFRAYGTSELEVLETVDSEEPVLDDEEEEEEVVGEKRDLLEELENSSLLKKEVKEPPSPPPPPLAEKQGEKTNLFGSAKAAVLSIVKKATEVLGKTSGNQTSACGQGGILENSPCLTPSYQIVCSNCSNNFYSRLYNLVCCHGTELQCLLANPFIHSVISESQLCNEIGLNWTDTTEPAVTASNNLTTKYSPKVEYIKAFLPREMIAALCNYLAVNKKTLSLNTAQKQFINEGGDKAENLTNNIKSNDEPKEDLKENETQIIQPTKVVPEETVISPEKEILETSAVTEPSALIEESQINATVAPTLPAQPIINETVDKAVLQEEPNATTQQLVMVSNGDEPVTIDSLALDSLFPEVEEDKVKPEDTGEQEETKAPVTVQKESVFVRQANRIKALEVNLSLSSQYLEELSRRYKKQVEELQRSLNSILEERRLASEREIVQGAQLTALANKIEVLSLQLGELIDERDSWSNKLITYGQHGIIVLFEVIGFIVLVWLWRTLGSSQPQQTNEKKENVPLVRRHSAEEPCKINKVRRPSEEALLPSGNTHNELLTEAPRRKVSRDGMRKRKRRRKGGDVIVIGSGESDWQPLQPPAAPEFMKTAMWQRG